MSKRVRRTSTDLDAETEGLLSDLLAESDSGPLANSGGGTLPASPPPPARSGNTVDSILNDLSREDSVIPVERSSVADTGSEAEHDEFTGEFTDPDDIPLPSSDSISDIIRVDSTLPPAPASDPDFDHGVAAARGAPAGRQVAREPERAAPPVAAEGGPDPFLFGPDLEEPVLERRRRSPMLWLVVVVFAGGALAAVVYTQTRGSGAERAAVDDQDLQRRREATMKAYEQAQAKSGELVIRSSVAEAAVWMHLGRTPVESIPLPSSTVHELRIEHEGFIPVDMQVTANHWSGDASNRVAHLAATLVAGELEKPLPAYPPAPEVPPTPGGPGRGAIVVESTPSGAEVWMLVGFTPEARIAGVEVGRDYQFRLQKDEHNPAFVVFKADDWFLAGPDSPHKSVLEGAAELTPRPAGDGQVKERKKTGKRR